MRRLIIIAVAPGKDPEVELEGEWAWWEVQAVLTKAGDMLTEEEFAQDEEEEDV